VNAVHGLALLPAQAVVITEMLLTVRLLAKALPTLANGDHPNLSRQQRVMEVNSPLELVNMIIDTPPASPSLSGSPVMQRRRLALLPRSEHPQEPTSTPGTDEIKPKSNPFGAARPVDTDTVLKKVEEKLAKEKEHKEEVHKASTATNLPPASPTGPRHDKARTNPKQLLRRTSANPTAAAGPTATEIDAAVSTKAEAKDESISEGIEKAWRKPATEAPVTNSAPSAVAEEEAGWETVPSRSKKVNGVSVRH
jgi:hypothetical protein